MQTMLMIVSALVVGAFFTVWTIQRGQDLAVLKAVGASTRYLLQDALGQSSIVLVLGSGLGAWPQPVSERQPRSRFRSRSRCPPPWFRSSPSL